MVSVIMMASGFVYSSRAKMFAVLTNRPFAFRTMVRQFPLAGWRRLVCPSDFDLTLKFWLDEAANGIVTLLIILKTGTNVTVVFSYSCLWSSRGSVV